MRKEERNKRKTETQERVKKMTKKNKTKNVRNKGGMKQTFYVLF